MRTRRKHARWGFPTALIGLLAAQSCTPEASGDPVQARSAGTEASTVWTASSVSGTEVTLSSPGQLEAGPTRLDISLDPVPSDALPVTLDLVSPEMPMHGVVRYRTEALGQGRFRASLDFPMGGSWELYVNLDYGADAAVFELEVAEPEGAETHPHHAH